MYLIHPTTLTHQDKTVTCLPHCLTEYIAIPRSLDSKIQMLTTARHIFTSPILLVGCCFPTPALFRRLGQKGQHKIHIISPRRVLEQCATCCSGYQGGSRILRMSFRRLLPFVCPRFLSAQHERNQLSVIEADPSPIAVKITTRSSLINELQHKSFFQSVRCIIAPIPHDQILTQGEVGIVLEGDEGTGGFLERINRDGAFL